MTRVEQPDLSHLLGQDPAKMSDEMFAAFKEELCELVPAYLEAERAPGGLYESARQRGPAYARLADKLLHDHRVLRREVAHLNRLRPTSRAARLETRALLNRLREHEKEGKALMAAPRRRRRSHKPAAADTEGLRDLQAASRMLRFGEVDEDATFVDANTGLAAVIDGIGGPGSGDVAVSTALEVLSVAAADLAELLADDEVPDRRAMADFLEVTIDAIHRAIQEQAELLGEANMGAALVLAVVLRERMYLAHVGHSRCYLLRSGRLRQLTEDHTEAMALVRHAGLDMSQYERRPERHQLTRVVGTPGVGVEADLAEVELADGDVLALCSDGVPKGLAQDAIMRALQRTTPAEAADALVAARVVDKARDDVSAIVVHVGAPRGAEQADRVADALADAFLFRNLTDAERVTVARYLEPRLLEPGEILLAEGEPATHFYVVAEGRLAVRRNDTPLTEVAPGGQLGELCLARPVKRSATAKALERTLVYGLSRDDFRRLCVRNPRLGQRMTLSLLDYVSERLRDLTKRVDRDRRARDLRRRMRESSD